MTGPGKLYGGVLLIAGTTIGAGMLALPVATGEAGFIPSLLLFFLYWVFMTFTAFLMLEVNLWMEENTNLISMAKKTLGPTGEIVCWVFYLFLLYALTTAYVAGSGPIVVDLIHSFTGWDLPDWMGLIPLLLLFGFFIYKGTRYVDRLNRMLMLGLVVTFLGMVGFLSPHVDTQLLEHRNWKYLTLAVSVAATSFGFHIIIPSLTAYFHRDVARLRKAILIGSVIPLVVYIVWQYLALGIISVDGENGIVVGLHNGANGVRLLTLALGDTRIALIARFFSFFAILTSFLGVSLSLSDFLADGLRIRETPGGRGILCLLTFVPPVIFTLTDPRAFLSALEYAGAFGVVMLLSLLPVLMVWVGRYHKGFESTFKAPGGKITLVLAMLTSIAIVVIEVMNKIGYFGM